MFTSRNGELLVATRDGSGKGVGSQSSKLGKRRASCEVPCSAAVRAARYPFCENGVSFACRPACHYFAPRTVHDLDHLQQIIYREITI